MTNLDDLRKHLTLLSDEALLEVPPEELTETAKAVYDAELQSRGLHWPSIEEDETELTGSLEPGLELVSIARYESMDEARFAHALLKNEGIPVWLAGGLSAQKRALDPNAPLELVTKPEFLEQAQLALSTEVSEEELARQAEEAGVLLEDEGK